VILLVVILALMVGIAWVGIAWLDRHLNRHDPVMAAKCPQRDAPCATALSGAQSIAGHGRALLSNRLQRMPSR